MDEVEAFKTESQRVQVEHLLQQTDQLYFNI